MEHARNNHPRQESPRRLVVCLVADEQVIERFPTAVRYLQIGLIDESIHTVLVLPEHSRAESLASGPTILVTHRGFQWPLARWVRRGVIAEVQQRIAALHHDASVIIHCLTGSTAPLAADLAAAIGGDLMLSLSSTTEINNPNIAVCIDKAAALITPSERLQRVITSSPVVRKPVEVVQFGATPSNAPTAFSTPHVAPALVFAGALSADCGVDSLLHAAKRVTQHHPDLSVFIIGKGQAENRLRRLVETLGLRQNVTFTGRLEHWKHALEAADIFCIPHSQTTLREEPIHAFATGLAVVAAEDSLYDGLIDQQTALLFPDRDDALMAEQIRRLLNNPDFARTIAATAQAYARSHNSVARMVAEHVRIYRHLEGRSSLFSMNNKQQQ